MVRPLFPPSPISSNFLQAVRGAVQAGEYASSSEIVRAALRDWRHKRALQDQELGELRAQVQEGLADIAAGRVRDFDAERTTNRRSRLQPDAAPLPAKASASGRVAPAALVIIPATRHRRERAQPGSNAGSAAPQWPE